jgi:N-acetylglucosamine-6-phosphate deacetylase
MRYTLRGARLIDAATDTAAGDVTIDGARIAAAGRATARPGTVIAADGMIVVPGFIDVHTHGGGGCNLHTTDPDEILRYARWVASTGVTSFLIGVVGTPGGLPEAQLGAAAAAIDLWREGMGPQGAEPLGIHLEGPYINERRRGAHPVAWLRAPDTGEMERVIELARGCLRLVTLAPELPGAPELIRLLVRAGVTVSMGHTDATYEQALEAIQLGVSHVTHCCNAMRPMLHRDPGPLSAAAQVSGVFGEVIADGVHVHPAMVNVLVKLLGADRAIMITDALAAAGKGDADFEFAGQPARVVQGVARLADGTITGSVLTLDAALRNVARMTAIPLPAAVGTLTRNPARSIRVDERKGLLHAGFDADLVILDADLTVQATICRGAVAYATDEWRERLGAV